MRIVHVITRLIVGGAQENTLLSCEGQHDRGHDVTLITGPALGPEGSLMDRARAGGYRVVQVDEMPARTRGQSSDLAPFAAAIADRKPHAIEDVRTEEDKRRSRRLLRRAGEREGLVVETRYIRREARLYFRGRAPERAKKA